MKLTKLFFGATLASLLLSGTAYAQTKLTMWYHAAGAVVEGGLIQKIVTDFNASQSDWAVTLQSFPQAVYNDSVVAGALAGSLPDILDVDGPILPNWAWAGYLQPLSITNEEIANFLPGTKGVWKGKLYGIGIWDAAVALVTRQSTLDTLGLRTPTLEKPWNMEEFMGALDAAKASGKYAFPLDLGTAWTGEWYPYAFSPFLQSFGGDLVDRSTYKTAEGALNGPAALAWGKWWQNLFAKGYAPGTSQDPADRDSGFSAGKYAFSWNGSWAATGALKAFDDTIFLPAPNFGHGSIIGAASWQFSISAASKHPDGATAFIRFAMQDKNQANIANVLGSIPATASAAAMTELYKEGGRMAPFFALTKAQGFLRPVTPGYVVEAKVFEKAAADIANGADVTETLDAAVSEIDADIKANNNYGH